jgi:BMFP domain-containing protein YqiC
MSRTSKFTLAVTLAFSAMTAQVQAQESSDAAMLAAIMNSMSSGSSAESGNLRLEIEGRIRDIMQEIDSKPTTSGSKVLTIEEIDAMNRMAERERTELEYETARFQRMEIELQRLMTFYEAVKTIEDDNKTLQEENRVRITEMMPKDEGPKADPNAQKLQQDQKMLPRIDSISGIGGVFSAEAEFDGETIVTLRPGARVTDGFLVEDIQSTHVMLRGPSSNKLFRITPKAPPAPMPETPAGPGGVIDLSQFPMAQF